MSIPTGYKTAVEYFNDCVSFLEEFSWIYNTSNTKFIKDGVIDKIPLDWMESLLSLDKKNFNAFPEGKNEVTTLCQSLRTFQEILKKLTPSKIVAEINSSAIQLKGVGPKKSHEITELSNLIHEICKDEVDIFLDFGCGLGYLSEILVKNTKYNVLGFECDEERVIKARKRLKKYFPSAEGRVFFEQQFLTLQSKTYLEEKIPKLFPTIGNPRIAIVGLHACADLSVTSIQLFFEMEHVRKFILMPCCYHKLELDTKTTFKNIPLSQAFKSALLSTSHTDKILNRPFLRLACQETLSRWKEMSEEDHRTHGNEMFLRSVMECLASKDEDIFKVQKSINTKTMDFSIVKFQYELRWKLDSSIIEWSDKHEQNFNELILKYPKGNCAAEVVKCLQTALQILCENIVLLDRICYIDDLSQQCDQKVISFTKNIMNDKLSPRSYAFIIEKI